MGRVGYGAAPLHLAFLSEAGDDGLAGLAALRRRTGQVALWAELARPWLDELDGRPGTDRG